MTNRYKLIKVTAVSLAIAGGGAFLYNNTREEKRNLLLAQQEEIKIEPQTKWDFNWDKREPSALIKPPKSKNKSSEMRSKDDLDILNEKNSSRATRHLFLIRHGQYEINEKESDKKVLTQLGREQAKFTGNYLKELSNGRGFEFSKIHSSTMIRAIQTAEIIKSHLPSDIPYYTDLLLCEGSPIPPEPPIGSWRPEFYHFQDGPRIEAAFRRYFHRAEPEQLDDSFEIIVCHANVIRYVFCRVLQFPPEAWLRFELGHGSITHIVIRPDGKVFCKTLGEVGFLPTSKLTTT